MGSADAPVDPELLDQEGGGDEALAVGDPALGEQLSHAGVHERVAGAALLPGGGRVGIVAPGAATGMQVAPLQLGVSREELGEEVAPAKLPEQVLRSAAGDLGRGDRAEVEVGGEGDRVGAADRRPRVDRRRQRPLAPRSPVRAEDAVMVAPGGRELAGRHDRDAGEEADLEALGQPGRTPARVGTHVLAQIDRVWAEAPRFLHRVAVRDDEPERLAQLVEPLFQEG